MDSDGQLVRLESLLKRGAAVISFCRGGWLPCIAQATEQRNKFTFPVLIDIKNVVARRLGIIVKPTAELLALYEKSHHLLREAADFKHAKEFPIPSAFVVDQDRTIRMAYLEQDTDEHMAPAMALRARKRLHG